MYWVHRAAFHLQAVRLYLITTAPDDFGAVFCLAETVFVSRDAGASHACRTAELNPSERSDGFFSVAFFCVNERHSKKLLTKFG